MSNLGKIFKINRKTFFDPAGWLGYESLKQLNITLYNSIKPLFTPAKPGKVETFAQAKARLKLTEEDLKETLRSYHRNALIFSISGLIVFLYAFFLLFRYHTLFGWLLGLGAAGILLSQAFKYDFWALEIKKRKLGLSFADWKKSRIGN